MGQITLSAKREILKRDLTKIKKLKNLFLKIDQRNAKVD